MGGYPSCPSTESLRLPLNVYIVIRYTVHNRGNPRSSAVYGEEIGRGDMRGFGQWIILLISSTFAAPLNAAQTTSTAPAAAVCTFADGQQISVRYDRESTNARALQSDEVWMPGASPMILFTQTALSVGNVNVPIGAYSLY